MAYIIKRTDSANEDLLSIINYIASDTQSINTAIKCLDILEEGINKLLDFPEIGVKPRYKSVRSQDYRVLIIENKLVFYKIFRQKKEIIIYRILDGRQEYKNMI